MCLLRSYPHCWMNDIRNGKWRGQKKEGMLIQDIDLGRVDEVREQLPLIKQRRTDIYRLEKVEK